jgi:hypothetical protein
MNASDRFLRFAAECELMAKFTLVLERGVMASHGRAMDTMCRIDRTARFGGSRCRVNEEKSETRTKFCSLERANCNANRVRAV